MASDNSGGMLGTGASKPPAFRRIVNLYNSDLPFRGLTDFAIIGAAVMLFLHPPSAETLSSLKLSALTDFFKGSGTGQQQQATNTQTGPGSSVKPGIQPGPGSNVQPGPGSNVQPGAGAGAGSTTPPPAKIATLYFDQDINRPALQNIMIVEIDDAMFRSSSAADQPKLVAAARAHRSRRQDEIMGLLKDARDADPNVAFMRGMSAGNSTNAETRKTAFQYFKAAADAGHPIASALAGRLLITGLDGLTKNVELGRQLIEKSAASGSRLGQRAAAIAYINGEFGVFDPVKARELFAQSAKAGDPQAMLHYSNMLFNGIAGQRDPVAGEDFLRRSAASGLTSAQRTLGTWLVEQYKENTLDDPKEAVEWLERAYTAGHSVAALVDLSAFYGATGRTPPWNSKDKYFEVINKCSAINFGNCQFNVGLAYHNGWGTKRDLIRAYAHYQIAKDLRTERADHNFQLVDKELTASERTTATELAKYLQANIKPIPPLWHMQYVGVEPPASPWIPATYVVSSQGGASGEPTIGFNVDFITPKGWYYRLLDIDVSNFGSSSAASKDKIAAAVKAYREGRPGAEMIDILRDADQNDPGVMYLRAVALYIRQGGNSADDNRAAKQLVTQAVQGGQKDAEVLLALLQIYSSSGIERDVVEGRRLLEAAAARNDRHALRQLGILYSNGLLGSPDHNAAAQNIKRAADAGDPVANLVMAAYHEKGIGVPRDMKLAEDFLRQSARLGSTLAQAELGEWQTRLARLDKGGNPEEGVKWLDRAFSQGRNFNSLVNTMLLHIDAPRGSPWRNHVKAFEMSKGCIEFKFSRCHHYMGYLMEYGEGVNRDPMRAFAYYDVARSLGANMAQNLDRLEKRLTSNEIASARDLSQALQKRLKNLPFEVVFQPPLGN